MKTKKLNGELISKAVEYINSVGTTWRKLSEFYSSRSTTYCSLLDSDLFEICKDSDMIVNLGFDKRVKAIVKANVKNDLVRSCLANQADKLKNEQIANKILEEEFDKMKDLAKEFIKENKELVDRLNSANGTTSRGDKKTAWILSLRASDLGLQISKRAFLHSL